MDTINHEKTQAQIYFCCAKDVLFTNSRLDTVVLRYANIEASNYDNDLTAQVVCFGRKGDNFAISSWERKTNYDPIDKTREGLWFAHQETEGKTDAKISEIIKIHKECGLDTDWLNLVKKARDAKSNVPWFFVTWLNLRGESSAQIYYNYIKWFFAQ